MHHRQDMDSGFDPPVGHDIWILANNQFPGTGEASPPPDVGIIFQRINTILDGLHDPSRRDGIVPIDVTFDSTKIGKRLAKP